MLSGSNCADSISTFTVRSPTSVFRPPITPAIATGFSASAITSIESSSSHAVWSMLTSRSPPRARRTTMRPPASLSWSKQCSGWEYSNST